VVAYFVLKVIFMHFSVELLIFCWKIQFCVGDLDLWSIMLWVFNSLWEQFKLQFNYNAFNDPLHLVGKINGLIWLITRWTDWRANRTKIMANHRWYLLDKLLTCTSFWCWHVPFFTSSMWSVLCTNNVALGRSFIHWKSVLVEALKLCAWLFIISIPSPL